MSKSCYLFEFQYGFFQVFGHILGKLRSRCLIHHLPFLAVGVVFESERIINHRLDILIRVRHCDDRVYDGVDPLVVGLSVLRWIIIGGGTYEVKVMSVAIGLAQWGITLLLYNVCYWRWYLFSGTKSVLFTVIQTCVECLLWKHDFKILFFYMLKTNLHIFLLIDNIIFLTVYVLKLALEHLLVVKYLCNARIQDEQIYQDILD